MRNTEPVLITKDYIMKHRTKRGAWTKVQIEALGIEWPPRQGWIDDLIGEVITTEQANQFETGRNKSASTVRKEYKANLVKSSVKDALDYLEANYRQIGRDEVIHMAMILGRAKRNNRSKKG